MTRGKFAERAKTKRAADGVAAGAIAEQNRLRAELRRVEALPAENARLQAENARLRGGLADEMRRLNIDCLAERRSALTYNKAYIEACIKGRALRGFVLELIRDFSLEQDDPQRYALAVELCTNLNRAEDRAAKRALSDAKDGKDGKAAALRALIATRSGGTPPRSNGLNHLERALERVETELAQVRAELRDLAGGD